MVMFRGKRSKRYTCSWRIRELWDRLIITIILTVAGLEGFAKSIRNNHDQKQFADLFFAIADNVVLRRRIVFRK